MCTVDSVNRCEMLCSPFIFLVCITCEKHNYAVSLWAKNSPRVTSCDEFAPPSFAHYTRQFDGKSMFLRKTGYNVDTAIRASLSNRSTTAIDTKSRTSSVKPHAGTRKSFVMLLLCISRKSIPHFSLQGSEMSLSPWIKCALVVPDVWTTVRIRNVNKGVYVRHGLDREANDRCRTDQYLVTHSLLHFLYPVWIFIFRTSERYKIYICILFLIFFNYKIIRLGTLKVTRLKKCDFFF